MGGFNQDLFNSQLFNGPGGPPDNGGGGGSGPTVGEAVENLLYHALRIAGVINTAGRTRSQGMLDDSLWECNAMVNGWQAERLMIRVILRNVFALTAGKQRYSIGLDASAGNPDFMIERPEQIVGAGYLFQTSPVNEVPVRILLEPEFRMINIKDLATTFPTMLYYYATVPNGTIQYYPVPTQTGQATLYTWQTLQEFKAVNENFVAAPAYRECLVWNLAARLWQRFPRSVLTPDRVANLMKNADKFKAKVKSINAPELLMQCEKGILGRSARGNWNPFTNRYN